MFKVVLHLPDGSRQTEATVRRLDAAILLARGAEYRTVWCGDILQYDHNATPRRGGRCHTSEAQAALGRLKAGVLTP